MVGAMDMETKMETITNPTHSSLDLEPILEMDGEPEKDVAGDP